MAPPTLDQATTVSQLDSHTYTINLDDDWCIGSVPHGGYVTSCFLRVAEVHFNTTLKRQNQPHSMTVHMEFPKRTERGAATFKVKDVKLGRQTSLIHITLVQHEREVVLCYINQSNLSTESGISFQTDWALVPPTAPTPDFSALLKYQKDENWIAPASMPFSEFRRATNRIQFYFPRNGQVDKSIADQWLRFSDPSATFTNASLGYVCDMFPQIVEGFREDGDSEYKTVRASTVASPSDADVTKEQETKKEKPMAAKFWYPTVTLNLDVKKALPETGVEWLFSRVRSKSIQRGRLDIEVVIMDAGGEIVALSHHVALVLDASRNLAKRRKGESQSQSKI